MKIITEKTYEAFGQRVATDVLRILKTVQNPLICPTAGNTPTAVYRALVQQIKMQHIDVSQWRFVGLDEWASMDGSDAGSCRHFINNELFEPLAIAETAICFFDGKCSDVAAECSRVETFIESHGGIDVALLGLGLNGHIGMNEPGTPATARAHAARLSPHTQSVGQKYFTAKQNLANGLTLGLGTLLEARYIFLLANGSIKAQTVKQVVEAPPTDALPATHVKQHSNFTLYLDAEAAHLLPAMV